VQDRCMVCTECTTGIEKLFWTHSMGLLGDDAQVEAWFHSFGDSATLDAWGTVCVERTIGSEIVFEAPDGTPR
jgi:hypothetical protein